MELDNRDGDLYLIRYIKQKPMIWDPSHTYYHDREKRDQVFKELSKSIQMNRKLMSHKNKNKMLKIALFSASFLKRRWITLRERYVKQLRCQVLKNSTNSSYKYNQEMSFLKQYVKLKIQSNVESTQSEQSYEFEITEEDLRLHDNEEDFSGMFVELDDEVQVDAQELRPGTTNTTNVEKKCDKTEKETNELMVEDLEEAEVGTTTTTTMAEIEEPKNVSQPVLIEVPPSPASAAPVPETPPPKQTLTTDSSVRNEDVIFGELIVSQLMKISDEAKKRAIKRSILDLFFY